MTDIQTQYTPNREELAWAAGFFDGEGTTRAAAELASLRLSVGQKTPELLERFRRAVGGVGQIYKETRGMYRWQVQTFEGAQHVLAVLWAFLGDPKKAQAKTALGKYNARPMRRRRHRLVRRVAV